MESRGTGSLSSNAGPKLFASESADDTAWDAGLLLGYRLGLGALDLDIEGDIVTHGGEVSGYLPGAGTSPGRNLLGEAWPEDWTLAKDRSYGITARLGAPLPMLGADVSAFVGIRRLDATFGNSYTGCPLVGGCRPDEFIDERGRRVVEHDAWVAGVALEKSFGRLGIRCELRYADFGSSRRSTRFDELAIAVATGLESSETGVGVSLLWRP